VQGSQEHKQNALTTLNTWTLALILIGKLRASLLSTGRV